MIATAFFFLFVSLLMPIAVVRAVATAPSQQNDQVPSTTGSCSVVSSGFQPGLWFNEDAIGRTNFAHVTNIDSPSWNLGKAGAMDGFKVMLCLTGSSDAPKYDLFRQNLVGLGFATTQSCDFAGQLTPAAFNVAVMIDTACDGGSAPLSDADVHAFVTFFESGRGAYVLADNCPCFANANKILAALQAPLSGLELRGNDGLNPSSMDYGNPLVPGQFGNHPVFTGVPHMSTGDTLSAPYVNGIADSVGSFGVLATVSCGDLVLCTGGTDSMTSHPSLLYVDPPVLFQRGSAASKWGRMVVDMALTRFFDSNFGANRYGANAVVWLSDPDRYYRGLVVYQNLPDSIKHGVMVEGCFTGDSFTIAFNATPATRNTLPRISFLGAGGGGSSSQWVPRCLMVENVTSCPVAPQLSCAKCYVDLHGGEPGHFVILVNGLNSTVGFVVQPASLIPRATLVSWTGTCRANADRTSVEACSEGDSLTISWTLPNPTTMSFAGSNGALACAELSISGTQLTCTLGPTFAAVPNGAFSIEIQQVPTGITFRIDGGCRNVASRFMYCRHGDPLRLPGTWTPDTLPNVVFVPNSEESAVPNCLAVTIAADCNGSETCDALCVLDLTFVDVAGPTAWRIEVDGIRVPHITEVVIDLSSLALANGLASVAPFASSWACGAQLVGSTVMGCVATDLIRANFADGAAQKLSTATISLFPTGAVEVVAVDHVTGSAVLRLADTGGIVGPGFSGNFALMLNGSTTGLAVPHVSSPNGSSAPSALLPPTWSVIPLRGNSTGHTCVCGADDSDAEVCGSELACEVSAPSGSVCAWILIVSTHSFHSSTIAFVATNSSGSGSQTLRCTAFHPLVVHGTDPATSWSSSAACFLDSAVDFAPSIAEETFALVSDNNFTGITVRLLPPNATSGKLPGHCPAPGSAPPPLDPNATSAVPSVIVRHAINQSASAAGHMVRHFRNVSHRHASTGGGGMPAGSWPWNGGGGAWWPGWYDYVCWWDSQWYACVWGGGGDAGPSWWPWPDGGGSSGGDIPSSWWWPGSSGSNGISGGWLYPSYGGGGAGGWSGGAGGFSPTAGGSALAPGSTTGGSGAGGGARNGPHGSSSGAGATVNILPMPAQSSGGGGGGSAGGLSPGFWRRTASAAGAAAGGSCAVILFATDEVSPCRAIAVWEAIPGACGDGVASAATAPSSAFTNYTVGRNLSPLNPPRVNLTDLRSVAGATTPLGATVRQLDSCNPASSSNTPFSPIPASTVPGTRGSQGTAVPPDSPSGLPATRVVVIVVPLVPPNPTTPPPPPPPPPHATANVSCSLRGGANDTSAISCRLCLTDGACAANATSSTECREVPMPVRPETVANVCHHSGFVPAPPPASPSPPSPPPTLTPITTAMTTAPASTASSTTGVPTTTTTTVAPAPTKPAHHSHASPAACNDVPNGAQMCILPTLDCYTLPYTLISSVVFTGVVAVAGYAASVRFASNANDVAEPRSKQLVRRALTAVAILCVCLQDVAAVGALLPRLLLKPSASSATVLRHLAAVLGQQPDGLSRCLMPSNATITDASNRQHFTVESSTGTLLAVSTGTVIAAGVAMLAISHVLRKSADADGAADGSAGAPDDLQSNLMGTVQDDAEDSTRRDLASNTGEEGCQIATQRQVTLLEFPEVRSRMSTCWGAGHLVSLTVLALLQCTPAVALLMRAAVWVLSFCVAVIHATRAGRTFVGSCFHELAFVLLAGASIVMAFASSSHGTVQRHDAVASFGLLVYVATAVIVVATCLAGPDTAFRRHQGVLLPWLAIAASPCVFLAGLLLPGLELAHAGALLLVIVSWAAASAATFLLPGNITAASAGDVAQQP